MDNASRVKVVSYDIHFSHFRLTGPGLAIKANDISVLEQAISNRWWVDHNWTHGDTPDQVMVLLHADDRFSQLPGTDQQQLFDEVVDETLHFFGTSLDRVGRDFSLKPTFGRIIDHY